MSVPKIEYTDSDAIDELVNFFINFFFSIIHFIASNLGEPFDCQKNRITYVIFFLYRLNAIFIFHKFFIVGKCLTVNYCLFSKPN